MRRDTGGVGQAKLAAQGDDGLTVEVTDTEIHVKHGLPYGTAGAWYRGALRAVKWLAVVMGATCHCEWPAGVLSAGLGASPPAVRPGSERYQDRQIRRCTGISLGTSRRPGMNGTSNSRIVARPVM
jgi:hypothetical protein